MLTCDDALQVIDPVTGTVTRIPVTGAWEKSGAWQDPHPQVFVVDGMAQLVTGPATQQIHAVDVEGGEVWKSADPGG